MQEYSMDEMDSYDLVLIMLNTDRGVTSETFLTSGSYIIYKTNVGFEPIKFDKGFFGPRSVDIIGAISYLYNSKFTSESVATNPNIYSRQEYRLTKTGKDRVNDKHVVYPRLYDNIMRYVDMLMDYQDGYSIQYVAKALYEEIPFRDMEKFCDSTEWSTRNTPIQKAVELYKILTNNKILLST